MRDIAVVGGGPAGLAVALGGARAGLDVAVVERRPGVIDKACGEGLMPGALVRLQALGIDPPGHRIAGITYVQGTRRVHAAFKGGPGRGVRRTDLHAALHEAAERAGVTFVEAQADTVEPRPGGLAVAGVAARHVVAADGLHSTVRRQAGLAGPPLRGRPRWGLRQHFRVRPWTDDVEVTWADRSECYVTPVADDVVGVAVLSGDRGGLTEQLAAFPDVAARVAGAEPVSGVRGAGPLRQSTTGRVAGRILLVGDAAGYVDALTGEGLAVSLAAAQELVRCLLADRAEDYERAWTRVTRRSRWLTTALLRARTNRLLGPRVVPLAAAAPWLFGAAVDQLAR